MAQQPYNSFRDHWNLPPPQSQTKEFQPQPSDPPPMPMSANPRFPNPSPTKPFHAFLPRWDTYSSKARDPSPHFFKPIVIASKAHFYRTVSIR